MAKCQVCGRGTFGRICGPCQKAGSSPDGVIARAREMGFEVLWSPVNQGYVVLSGNELVGIKNTIQDVRTFLDEWRDDVGS